MSPRDNGPLTNSSPINVMIPVLYSAAQSVVQRYPWRMIGAATRYSSDEPVSKYETVDFRGAQPIRSRNIESEPSLIQEGPPVVGMPLSNFREVPWVVTADQMRQLVKREWGSEDPEDVHKNNAEKAVAALLDEIEVQGFSLATDATRSLYGAEGAHILCEYLAYGIPHLGELLLAQNEFLLATRPCNRASFNGESFEYGEGQYELIYEPTTRFWFDLSHFHRVYDHVFCLSLAWGWGLRNPYKA